MIQKSILRAATVAAASLATAALLAAPTEAQNPLSNLEIHGFGGWAYGETDGLRYALGDSDGRWDNAEFALNVSARPTDRLSIVAQVFLESNGSSDDSSSDAELDYAFAEWFVSDALKVRAGRVKHPFGLYGEIFDVGTLRPFYLLPQSIYGPNGFTAKAYNGVGITGVWSKGAWGLQYDLYAGQIEGDFEIPGLLSTSSDLFLDPSVSLGFTVDDTVGFRLNLLTPLDGLTVGVSAYQGDERIGLDIVDLAERTTWLAHGEYLGGPWTVRAEWGSLENKADYGVQFEQEGGYLEVAYKITDKWEVAVRTEDWNLDFPSTDLSDLPPIVPQLMEHSDLAFGVSYWFTPGFVARLDYHLIEGNRFAFVDTPEEVLGALTSGQLDDQTELLVLGAQFSF